MATAVEVDIQATTETSSPQKNMPARFQSCRHFFIFGSRGFLGMETRRISEHNRKMDIPVRRFVGQAMPDSPSVNDCRNDVSLIERLHSNKEARRAHRTHTRRPTHSAETRSIKGVKSHRLAGSRNLDNSRSRLPSRPP